MAQRFKKILVIGCPGGGKSTFARKLRDRTGLPLHHLDLLWHRADRTSRTRAEFDAQLQAILPADQWIIDGNYLRTLELRLRACDTVILLDFPTEVCLSGAAERIGRPREDLPWVEETFDEEFRQWILDFSRDQLPHINRLLHQYQENRSVIVFHTRQEADRWLETLSEDAGPGCQRPF